MTRRRTWAAAALAAVAPCAGAAAQEAPPTTTLQLPAPLVLTGTLTVDVDGDGRLDLVLACRDPDTGRREVRVHRRRAEAPPFANEPSAPPYAVEKDVVAFCFADVDPAPGRELVLCTPEQVVAVVPGADGAQRYEVLAAHRLVWPAPDRGAVLPLAGACVDLDGDGHDDLLLPGPDGLAVLLGGRRPAPGTPCRIEPFRSALEGRSGGGAELGDDRLSFRFPLGDGDDDDDGDDRGPLLALQARAPRFLPVDADGDGRLDLVALRNGGLWCWRGDGDGAFAVVPTSPLPLPPDRLALFDPAFDVQLAKLDGDAVPDLVLTTSARRDDEIEVRVEAFRRAPDGTCEKPAKCRLRLQTLATAPQLVDADGDGVLDLVAVTVRTDRLRGLVGDSAEALDAQLNVFRGSGGSFATPALMTQIVPLPVERGGDGQPFVRVLAGQGGSPGDVLLRLGRTLVRRPLVRDGERLQLGPPANRLPLGEKARPRALLDAPGEVLVLDEHELLHVRMR